MPKIVSIPTDGHTHGKITLTSLKYVLGEQTESMSSVHVKGQYKLAGHGEQGFRGKLLLHSDLEKCGHDLRIDGLAALSEADDLAIAINSALDKYAHDFMRERIARPKR
jgi:hypothetical protein